MEQMLQELTMTQAIKKLLAINGNWGVHHYENMSLTLVLGQQIHFTASQPVPSI
jgi:hypothetical protein